MWLLSTTIVLLKMGAASPLNKCPADVSYTLFDINSNGINLDGHDHTINLQFYNRQSRLEATTIISVGKCSRLETDGSGSVGIWTPGITEWDVRTIHGSVSDARLGHSVAMAKLPSDTSGELFMAAGACAYDNYRGQVRVLRFNGVAWDTMIDFTGHEKGDSLGCSLDLVPSSMVGVTVTLAMGAYASDNHVGQVHIKQWDRINDSWKTLPRLSGKVQHDWFGYSVSLLDTSEDGIILAVGVPGYNDYIGKVEIYHWDGDTWHHIQMFTGDYFEHSRHLFGYTLSLLDSSAAGGENHSTTSTTLAIGGYGYNEWVGQVQVYQYNHVTGTWTNIGNFTGDVSDTWLGSSLALAATTSLVPEHGHCEVTITLAIGGFGYNGERGQVQVHQWNGGNWITIGDFVGEYVHDYAGSSVALVDTGDSKGVTMAIGAYGHAGATGQVQVFHYDTFKGRWTDIKTLLGERDGDWFGGSVSLTISQSSGDRSSVTLVVGAPGSDGMLEANNVGQLTVTHDIFTYCEQVQFTASLQDIIHQCEFPSEDLFTYLLSRC